MSSRLANSKSRVLIYIQGAVQAVGFRYFAREMAQKMGLFGYAKNLADGSVEIVAEGEKEVLEQFLAMCQQGPPHAKIEDVKVEWSDTNGQYHSFDVAYD